LLIKKEKPLKKKNKTKHGEAGEELLGPQARCRAFPWPNLHPRRGYSTPKPFLNIPS